MEKKKGTVYLIGAGPGDPGLITVRGKQLLDRCDAVIYDNLVSPELIVALPPGTETYYVGKKSGVHPVPQEDINRLMLKLAGQGKSVARLKGSDPLIFGRGGEEAKFLKEHGVPFEIITGVTSGIAAPCYAGIPCTDRHLASSVIFVTGHKASDKYKSSISWEWLARARHCTIVIYMGVGEIAGIAARLIDNGMPADTPAAVIERGTFPSQRVFISTLRQMPETVAAHKVSPPAIFVFGEVVTLTQWLEWFSGRPLAGLRIMVTRPVDQSAELYATLRELGAEPLPYPTIATDAVHDDDGWDTLKKCAGDNSWLLFTSENGVRYFFDQFAPRVGDIRYLARFKIAAVGTGTSRALLERHVEPDFIPSRSTVRDLTAEMIASINLEGAVVIRVRGDLADQTAETRLSERGVKVLPLTVYRTFHPEWPADLKEKLFEHPPHAMLFTSGSTVTGLRHNLTDEELKILLSQAAVFSLGPMVSRTLQANGIAVTRQADIFTVPGLIDALVDYYRKK